LEIFEGNIIILAFLAKFSSESSKAGLFIVGIPVTCFAKKKKKTGA